MFKAINKNFIEKNNKKFLKDQNRDFDFFQEKILKLKIDLRSLKKKVFDFNLALPSWGVGTGGTRFGRSWNRGTNKYFRKS